MNAADPTVSPHGDATQRPNLRILFLAARPAVITSLRRTLTRAAGIELELAVDPDEAAVVALRARVDLVLIDLPWAGRAGQRLVERLRAEGSGAKIAVLGDLSGKRAREAAKRIGANAFTPDPDSPDLLKVVRALTRPPERRRAAIPRRAAALEAA